MSEQTTGADWPSNRGSTLMAKYRAFTKEDVQQHQDAEPVLQVLETIPALLKATLGREIAGRYWDIALERIAWAELGSQGDLFSWSAREETEDEAELRGLPDQIISPEAFGTAVEALTDAVRSLKTRPPR